MMRLTSILLACLFGASVAISQQSPAPVLFFSDLTAGPATGNSDSTHGANGGAYVTLYGNFLTGATVSLGGESCLTVVSQPSAWLWYQRMTVQLGSSCTSGNFVATTSVGSSNGIPFTVEAGTIYYVATSGSDSNSGSFASPWATVPHAVQTAGASAGNIIYVENGVVDNTDDGQGWDAALTLRIEWCAGTTAAPDAVLAYPGGTVQIGLSNPTSPSSDPGIAIRGTDSSAGGGACTGNWTFGELTLRGIEPAATGGGNNFRWVGNDITNVDPDDAVNAAGAIEFSQTTNTAFYGNNAHNLNAGSTDSETQGVYFTTDSNGIDMGWNEVGPVGGCRGVQIHSSPNGGGSGNPMYNISIHDNTVHDTLCDGIIVDTFDANEGPVSVYNNVVYDGGNGPSNPDGGGVFSCINVQNTGDDNAPNAGTAEVFNNSVSSCGLNPSQDSPDFDFVNNCDVTDASFFMHIRNNLLYSAMDSLNPSGIPYFGLGCAANQMYGTNNLAYGAGAPTASSFITGTINANPEIVSLTTPDLHLTSGSPAVGAGASFSITPYGVNWTGHDHDGLIRPSTPSIGAYELTSGTPASLPSTLEISTTTLPEGQVGASYSQTLLASGGTPPYHWSITAGALPAGLTLSPVGVLSGTPTASGSPSITFGVSDSGSPAQTTSTALKLTILSAATPLSVTTTSVPNGDVSVAYPGTNLEAAGGTPPYSWSGIGLAAGLTVSTSGLISGTPTATGTFDESFTVTDSSSPKLSAVADFSVKISQAVASGQPKIVTDALPMGQVGVAYRDARLAATGGAPPYNWSATGLAPGLTLSSGVVSGTPTKAGTFAEKFTVTDSSSPAKTATATVSVTIASSRNRRRWRSSN